MTNYREILRLSSLQYSQRTIESMAHCSRHTVRDVLQAAKEQGISWPLSDDVANADLEQLLFPNRHKASSQYAEPDYPYIHRELARSGVTLTLLWEEYCIFRPSESKETVGVSPPSREKQVQVHGRESTGVYFGKKWQRNASQSAPPRVIYSDWNPFLLRMESSPSMRIL